MTDDLVTSELRGTVQRIAMNRVAKKNAITVAMYEQLTTALVAAGTDDRVRSILIVGAPGIFTAGNDLMDFAQRPPELGGDSPVSQFLRTLVGYAKPVVAAVDGAAVGIGTTMLLHCDHVIATERAKFHMPFTKLGLVPEAASSFLVPALVGRQRASQWLLLGRPFDVHEALAAGIVSKLVASAELDAAVEAVGAEFAALPAQAVIATKRLILEGTRAGVTGAMERESIEFAARLRSPEAMAAFTAFMTKR